MTSELVSVLFARKDSIYKTMPGCDVWDAERNALTWPGGTPVVAHPPCRAWGRLRRFAQPREGEKDLAVFAVDAVRRWGGILEHPWGSTLWDGRLPLPGEPADSFGGWTLPLCQFWFGHRAEKATWLYIVGITPEDVTIPMILGRAPRVIASSRKRRAGRLRMEVTKREREATPLQFAEWLVHLARESRAGAQQDESGK